MSPNSFQPNPRLGCLLFPSAALRIRQWARFIKAFGNTLKHVYNCSTKRSTTSGSAVPPICAGTFLMKSATQSGALLFGSFPCEHLNFNQRRAEGSVTPCAATQRNWQRRTKCSYCQNPVRAPSNQFLPSELYSNPSSALSTHSLHQHAGKNQQR